MFDIPESTRQRANLDVEEVPAAGRGALVSKESHLMSAFELSFELFRTNNVLDLDLSFFVFLVEKL